MKVSVITPTYNRLELLKRAVESFLNQDYINAEMIILDNGTSDGTTEYLCNLSNPKIRFVHRTKNTPIGSLNELWSHCKGDLICQLHDDDMLTANSISLRVEKFKQNPMLDMVYGGANLVNIEGEKTNFCPGELPSLERLLKTDYINFTTLMWKREIPFKIDDDFEFNLDWLFKIRCLKELRCDYVYSAVMDYTVHPGQETHRSRLSGAHDREIKMLRQKIKLYYGI